MRCWVRNQPFVSSLSPLASPCVANLTVQSPDVQTFSGTPVHEPTPAVRRSRSGEAGRASGNPKLKVALTPDDYKRERQQPDFGEDDPDLGEAWQHSSGRRYVCVCVCVC